MSRALDFYCRTYDRFMIVGDFNLEPENQTLQNFLNTHELVNLMKEKRVGNQVAVATLILF